MLHLILITHGVHLDLVTHLILGAFDIAVIGTVGLRIVEVLRSAYWADKADQRRDRWFATHPTYTYSASDGDDGA
jgi:hypothetical protein